MKYIEQSAELLTNRDYEEVIKEIERAGRTCYNSESDGTISGAERFISGIISRGHESVLEHFSLSVEFVTSRNITHQIVRHRIASYSQQSTRYVNQGKDGDISFIKPSLEERTFEEDKFRKLLEESESLYKYMKEKGIKNDIVRDILPGCLATKLIMTANVREWRHFFKLRCEPSAHPQIRELACLALIEMNDKYPIFFKDLHKKYITW